ncbi:hypothetical protein BBH99_18700 [Chryseobacterium contaminans]|uniref:Uncharacterized protein n=1 Tax=Chryseobacterium contaminans TaxID=1423959 RepID=A0A1M7ATG3_9FLAO|nr:hypothetical protein [Chryseobacterium contaminans]OCA79506.1 hypothetical protein BBH99_18700 [Chryseobacterium contaminans]SHL46024.1 hypothetical protein SAMN05444407_104110 [Chryseobacterium contaminans]
MKQLLNIGIKIIGIICLIATIIIAIIAYTHKIEILPTYLAIIFCGILFESYRISKGSKSILYVLLCAYFISLVVFFPNVGKGVYHFEERIKRLPYVLCFSYLIILIASHKKIIIPRLTEGVTLLLSVSFIYWLSGKQLLNFETWDSSIITIVTLLFSLISVINGLFLVKLSKLNRLILSIWSTIVVFVIGVDNLMDLMGYVSFDDHNGFSDTFKIAIQYFLFGMSSIYLAQNFFLLLLLVPSKEDKDDILFYENIRDHYGRYSESQVKRFFSIFCILYCFVLFYLNQKMKILPVNTIIWIVTFTFPVILNIMIKINDKIRKSKSIDF